MIDTEQIKIGPIPAIIWGPPSQRLVLAVHGNMSHKTDTVIELLAGKAIARGYQVDVYKRQFHDIAVKRMDVTGNSMPRVRVRELPNQDMVFLSILFGYDYNHIEYERNFNLLYPWTVDKVVEYVGHEMEPGHLTYFEKRLQTMIDTCWPEMSLSLIHIFPGACSADCQ